MTPNLQESQDLIFPATTDTLSAMATPLTGELSRRRLGTRSGDLRSLARRTNDPKARTAINMAAAQEKMNESSAITSAESNAAERDATVRRDAGLMESRRRQQFGSTTQVAGAGGATPPATPSLLDRKGVTSSFVQGPPAPEREGRIDGMPASQATARAEQSLRDGGPRQEFGADLANRNLGKDVTNESMRTALADYQRRSAADDPAARAGRGAAYVANNPTATRDFIGPPAPDPIAPTAAPTNEMMAANARNAGANAGALASRRTLTTPAPGGIPDYRDYGRTRAALGEVEPALPVAKTNPPTIREIGGPVNPTPVSESSVGKSLGARSTPVTGGFEDTLPGAAIVGTGRAIGGAVSSLYAAWDKRKPRDKMKPSGSMGASLSKSYRDR